MKSSMKSELRLKKRHVLIESKPLRERFKKSYGMNMPHYLNCDECFQRWVMADFEKHTPCN